ncbi:RDH13 isoform 20 [Pan troglodytes]|uniref:RDH13 isoform 20 n=1 Tax=Pan troglodytes TaxID=9598 RepID=A0A2J8IX46_PANTR|nr:RDH13 isoform 20 [Pan troglodytes]
MVWCGELLSGYGMAVPGVLASCARAQPESRCRCHPEFRLCTAWSGNPTSCCYRTWDCLGLPPSYQFSW